MYTSTSIDAQESERLKVIDAESGASVGFRYDRSALEREISADSAVNASFFQRLVPDFIERRFTDRSFWGEERHPSWGK